MSSSSETKCKTIEIESQNKARIVELKGDLFSVSSDVALAHCVSADMHMSKGIAVLFRDKFKNVDNLKKQC